MSDFYIEFDKESPQKKDQKINICIKGNEKSKFVYKFIEGFHGKWSIIKDFSSDREVLWQPKEEGIYTIMIQIAKDNLGAFEFVLREDFVIGDVDKNLIKALIIDKKSLVIGEKINAKLDSVVSENVLYRYYIKNGLETNILRDYSCKSDISWTVTDSGKYTLVGECKRVNSLNEFDSKKEVEYEVKAIKKVQIRDFKCLNDELYCESEIVFEVDAVHEDNRMILYKFEKIDSNGNSECVQDYSTRKILSYVEKGYGDFKILCFVKDMYSQNKFDDRAVINYSVKKYKEVQIKSFTTDLSSPQLANTNIQLKALANGGRKLVYRYIIEGSKKEDSGYIYEDSYLWNEKIPGEYTITLMVRDESSKEKYEDTRTINFIIDKIKRPAVKMKNVIIDKDKDIIKGETIKIKIAAEGGLDLRYGFDVEKNGIKIQKITYGNLSTIRFKFNIPGVYKINAYVKDKYSEKEYDAHDEVYINVFDYMPAKIEYVLINNNNYYMVGNEIETNTILKNTRNMILRYILKMEGRTVQDTGYIASDKYSFVPKCAGKYEITVFAKNVKSDDVCDSKKIVSILVHDVLPITDTKISCDNKKAKINETVTFNVECNGGKDILYEFYLMENGEWKLMQKYSRKNFYSFMIFNEGIYKVLVLCKSQFSISSYEDYDIIKLKV
ncbi:triple tyrosine motif-containing protein [Clostridium felsineum]|uniref:triple tyrosine motif-containing protein n=1 Tax=Clostridium felsineum TaxID=36839 RepID=UPI00214DAAB4|nr:triple tyrosine motif-containing protein [Clostridium felsineum]MCR3761599.1 triple tyrosine motif-containing protein [Clostridium felsineum]